MAVSDADATISRLRLLSALDGGRAIDIVSAPGGFGKSTLLRQWRGALASDTSTSPEIISLALAAPVDGQGFWERILDALPGAPASGLRSGPDRAVIRLQQLSAERPTVLVIDGLDRVSDERIAAELADLVGAGIITRLVASMRHYSRTWQRALAPRFPLVLSADDLAFTASEIEAFIDGGKSGGHPPPEVLAATGGWPLLVRVYVTTLSRSGPAAAGEEVTRTLARLLTFDDLTRTDGLAQAGVLALSEELTPEIARELSGEPVIEDRLERLVTDGLLEEDAATPSFRWPTSVRGPILRSLQSRDGIPLGAQSRISDWYLGRNEPAAALRHATLARDWARVIAILEKYSRTLLFAYTYNDLYEALHWIPLEHVASSRHVIALRDLWLPVPDEMLDEAIALPDSAAALRRLGRSSQARDTLEAGYLLLMALSRRGLSDRARDYGARLLQVLDAARATQPHEILELYPSLHLHIGLLYLIGGDYAAGLSSLWRAYDRADDNPRRYIRADAASKTALAYAVTGDHPRTVVWLDRYSEAPLESAQFEGRIRGTADAARLLMATDRLDLSTAHEAHDSLLAADTTTEEIFWAYLAYAEAQYALLIGTAEDMLEHLDRVETHYERWIGNGAIAGPLLTAARADLLLGLGRGSRAKNVLEGEYAAHSLLQVGKARLALATGQPDAALRYAADSAWMASATTRQRIDMQLIQAVAAARTGDDDLARSALRRASDVARHVRALRPFRTVAEPDLRPIADRVPEARRLLDEARRVEIRDPFPAAISMVILTPREAEILSRLTTGLSIQQIAISMRLSYNTVKVHVRSLYAKLGVSSREDAVAEARRHDLL